MTEDTQVQDTAIEQPEPAQQAPEVAPRDDASDLVDPNAVDAQGRRVWFPRDYVEELRSADAAKRVRIRELEEQMEANTAQPEPEQTTDNTAPLQARIDALENERRILRLEKLVLSAAAKATADRPAFLDPGDVVRLVDLSAIEWGEDGTPTNPEIIAEAVEKLAQEKPQYLQQSQARGARVTPSNPAGTGRTEANLDWLKGRLTGQGVTFGSGGVIPPQED